MGSKPKTPKLPPPLPPPAKPITAEDSGVTAAEELRKKNKKRRGRGSTILSGLSENSNGNNTLGG